MKGEKAIQEPIRQLLDHECYRIWKAFREIWRTFQNSVRNFWIISTSFHEIEKILMGLAFLSPILIRQPQRFSVLVDEDCIGLSFYLKKSNLLTV